MISQVIVKLMLKRQSYLWMVMIEELRVQQVEVSVILTNLISKNANVLVNNVELLINTQRVWMHQITLRNYRNNT
jgi:hypothetical protein